MQDENRSNTRGFNIKNIGCLGWILILVLGLIAMTFAIALYPAFWILAIPATIYFLKSKNILNLGREMSPSVQLYL